MQMKLSLCGIMLCGLMIGCHANGAGPQSAAGGQSDFEQVKDPLVTAETHFAAAQFAESQNNPAKAVEQYQLAVKLKPGYQPALYRLGILCTQLKLYPDAIAAWKGYIKATGDAATGYSDLGFAYQLSGDDVGAENSYKAGIAKDAHNRPCRLNYGLLLARQGKFDSALAQWQVVLTPAEVHYNLASVYEMRHEKAQARIEYRKSLELDPALADAKAKLAALDKD